LADLGNAASVLKFLVARKLGVRIDAAVALGHNGRVHSCPIVDRSDISVLEEIFLDHDYALDVSPPLIVFDLGANFGAASIYFAQRWPDAKIVAVEPSPAMFDRLVKMATAYPKITCLNYAVGEHDGKAKFNLSPNHVSSSLYRSDPQGKTIEVEVRTLDSLMSETGIEHVDVLKFDIEGAEELLFRDASILDRITTIVGEIHPDLMGMTSTDFLAQFDEFTIETQPVAAGRFIVKAARAAA
jgi:FkbM family methyltransferase